MASGLNRALLEVFSMTGPAGIPVQNPRISNLQNSCIWLLGIKIFSFFLNLLKFLSLTDLRELLTLFIKLNKIPKINRYFSTCHVPHGCSKRCIEFPDTKSVQIQDLRAILKIYPKVLLLYAVKVSWSLNIRYLSQIWNYLNFFFGILFFLFSFSRSYFQWTKATKIRAKKIILQKIQYG
jgi:hypothetical protein